MSPQKRRILEWAKKQERFYPSDCAEALGLDSREVYELCLDMMHDAGVLEPATERE